MGAQRGPNQIQRPRAASEFWIYYFSFHLCCAWERGFILAPKITTFIIPSEYFLGSFFLPSFSCFLTFVSLWNIFSCQTSSRWSFLRPRFALDLSFIKSLEGIAFFPLFLIYSQRFDCSFLFPGFIYILFLFPGAYFYFYFKRSSSRDHWLVYVN